MTTFAKLKLFIDDYNDTLLKPKELLNLQQHIAKFKNEYLQVWGQKEREGYPYTFRSSALGTHPFLLAWYHFYPREESGTSVKTIWKFSTGYLFELHAAALLDLLGYNYDNQRSIVYQMNEFTVGGHIDFVVENEGILETKCVNNQRFKEWAKAGYVNDNRYTMQLAMYCTRLQKPGMFLVNNVDTGELAYYDLDYSRYEKSILGAIGTCYYINQCEEWWQTLEKIAPPEPIKRKDGTYYIPPYMYESKGVLSPACTVYEYEQREGKYYVQGYQYPNAAKQWEPKLGE